jgi:hypothetical protein
MNGQCHACLLQSIIMRKADKDLLKASEEQWRLEQGKTSN